MVPRCHETRGRGEKSDPRGRPPKAEKGTGKAKSGCPCEDPFNDPKRFNDSASFRAHFKGRLPACRLLQIRILMGVPTKYTGPETSGNRPVEKGVLRQIISNHRKRKSAA